MSPAHYKPATADMDISYYLSPKHVDRAIWASIEGVLCASAQQTRKHASGVATTTQVEHAHASPLRAASPGTFGDVPFELDEGYEDQGNELNVEYMDEDEVSESSDTTSMQPCAYLHAWENGRRYHRYRHPRYFIPNDEMEQAREDMMHVMMLEATGGKLFFAPIGEHPQRIIDLGTGTGIWAIDAGEQFPSAEVLGIDMSPTQIEWVPPNVRFINDDLRESWQDGDNWDLVHLRHMMSVLEEPVALLKKAYSHVRPGGWVELQDMDGLVHCDDGTLPDDWPPTKVAGLLAEAFELYDCNAHAALEGQRYLEEAGFVNVQHHACKLPYGTWAQGRAMQMAGMYHRTAFEHFLPILGAMHLPHLGWSEVEMQVLFARCRIAMNDPGVHAYGTMHFWSGQRPREVSGVL